MAPPPRILLSYLCRRSVKLPPLQAVQSSLSDLIPAIQESNNVAATSGFVRYFSSSAPIKPVSYPTKPKDEDDALPSPPKLSQDASAPQADSFPKEESVVRPWSREDARYVKDVPAISPVSYAPKVAPLPEDKAEGESVKETDEQLQRETRRIEASARVRRAFLIQQEEDNVPFPTVIKPEKKKSKAALELQDAIREVKANSKRKFLETVEAHVSLGVDPRRGDQMVRGAVTLPHGTGKVVRVAVFAEGPAADEARAAGADIVGGDELVEEIMRGGGKIDFDKCIAVPSFMPRLGKVLILMFNIFLSTEGKEQLKRELGMRR